MEIVKININNLKPYKNNAKVHTPEQIKQIKKSIEEFGMNDPIAVWGEDNLIVEGHGRIEALKQLGYTEVDGKPYFEIVNIAKEYINKIGGFEKLAEWGLY